MATSTSNAAQSLPSFSLNENVSSSLSISTATSLWKLLESSLPYLALALTQVLFSSYHILSQVALVDHGVHPILLSCLRDTIAAPALFVLCRLIHGRFPTLNGITSRRDGLDMALLGASGVFGNQVGELENELTQS